MRFRLCLYLLKEKRGCFIYVTSPQIPLPFIAFIPHLKCRISFQPLVSNSFLQPTTLGTAPGQSVEEEGPVERIQEWQQPQGLPAGRGQLAPLQLVQQVSLLHTNTSAALCGVL